MISDFFKEKMMDRNVSNYNQVIPGTFQNKIALYQSKYIAMIIKNNVRKLLKYTKETKILENCVKKKDK